VKAALSRSIACPTIFFVALRELPGESS